jgi:hypothetical protein
MSALDPIQPFQKTNEHVVLSQTVGRPTAAMETIDLAFEPILLAANAARIRWMIV